MAMARVVASLLILSGSAAALSVGKPNLPSPHRVAEVARKMVHDQTSLKSAIQETKKEHDEACECVNWKQLYELKDARLQCGDGLEMFTYAEGKGDEHTRLNALHSSNGQKICNKFFKKLNNNFCVNVGQHNTGDAWHNKQWCYVDSHKCGRLNGGMHVSGSQVSWKLCNENDSRLRESTLDDLSVLSKADDLDLALLTKMAYPVNEEHLWWQVQGAWNVYMGAPRADGHKFIDQAYMPKMQKIQDSKEPMVFLNTKSGMPPFGVVVGNKAYEIQGNRAQNKSLPGTLNKAVCVNGCTPWGW